MNQFETALDVLLPESVQVIDSCSIGGGCISDAACVAVRDIGTDQSTERSLFVKSNDAAFIGNFQCEAEGLSQLANVRAIRIPRLLIVGLALGKSWLVTEWIDTGDRDERFFARFGLQLARLHRESRGDEIGWSRDNFLGSAKQPNESRSSWADFFASQRIEFQLRWAVDQGHCDQNLRRDCTQIVRNMAELLQGREDCTSLLHGDLWSGNYLCDRGSNPVLIDPAIYRGCREAEMGMLMLFGSCPPSFYDAYQAAWPMYDGWERRAKIYLLYHLMNHLNLFGTGYLQQCKSAAAEVLAS